MQDHRDVNEVVVPVHTIVPNLYNIQNCVPGDSTCFAVLDWKDAFVCIPLHPYSQFLFVFEWRDSYFNEKQQCTWAVPAEGFRDSPHLFGNAEGKEIREFQVKGAAFSNMRVIFLFTVQLERPYHSSVKFSGGVWI